MLVKNPLELGSLIRDRRQGQALTQATLAIQVGVSRKWIVDLESGKRTVDLSLVLRTLNVLGLELDARIRSGRKSDLSSIDLDSIVDSARRPKRR